MAYPTLARSLCALGLLVATPSCADDDSSASTTAASSTGTSSDPTTVSATSTSGSGSTSADGTAGSSGEGGECSPYADDGDLQGRDVVVTNTMDEAVFVAARGLCVETYLGIEPMGDAIGAFPNSSCYTCENAFSGGCACPAVCITSIPMLLAPGASMTIPWSGAVFQFGEPPEACYGEGMLDCAGQPCATQHAANGSYEVSVRWGPASALDDPICMCEPDAQGVCEIPNIDCGELATFSVNGVFDHPAMTDIELSI